jgi:oligopeptide transport system substrate-binding protein
MRPVFLLCGALAALSLAALRWSAPPAAPGGITVVFGAEPATLDPARATSILEMRILAALLEGLTAPDPRTLEPRPAAATWSVSADGTTYTFTIREGAQWSDGSPLTAEDFRKSWLRVLSMPDAPNWELLAPIRGARAFREKKTSDVGVAARGARTLEVVLERPLAHFPALLSLPAYLPVHAAAHSDRWTRPGRFLGNGPFTLDRWDPSHRIVVVRNPRFREPAGLPAITFLLVAPGSSQFNLYEGGVADWIADPPPDMAADLAGRSDLHLSPRLGISFVRAAARREPFDDPRVRRAFSAAVDRSRLVALNRAGQTPWTGFLPPGMSRAARPPLYDPDEARSLLVEAGHGGGTGLPRIRFLYPAQREFRVVAEALHAMWKDTLGVEVVLDRADRKEWLRRMRELDYELCLGSWIGDYPDATTFLDIFHSESGNNRTGWKDAAYDALLARVSMESGEARLEAIRAAEARLLEEGPAIPLYVPVTLEMWRPHLSGIEENLLGVHPLAPVRSAR